MKKTYIAPQCEIVAFNGGIMMSAGSSVTVDGSVTIGDETKTNWSREFGGAATDDTDFSWD